MQPIELKKGIYWVGAIDWSLRSFHGYATDRGATYNAYLIIDEKITLIDTVQHNFADQLIERIRQIVDPAKIDTIIMNHVEMDHSSALPAVMALAPGAKVYASAQGVKGLTLHYGDYGYTAVKAGDSLSLGSRALTFIPTPMLHWPDNMITYCPQEKLLFSNDAFGQHYATSGRFDDEVNLAIALQEAAKYYANIVMPFSAQVKAALAAASKLDIEMIAPSHGVIWRSHIPEILAAYMGWSDNVPANRAVVVFDSMWHATEQMAVAVAEGFIAAGVETILRDLKVNHLSDVMCDILDATYVAVGSPTQHNRYMATIGGFLTYCAGLAPKNRKGFAFGSYGWSGQSPALIEEALKEAGLEICLPPQRIQYRPGDEALAQLSKTVREMARS